LIFGEIVDEVSFPSDERRTGLVRIHSAIAVDQDDNIVELDWHEKADHSLSDKKVHRYLGRRVISSGALALSGVLPRGKLASNAVRVTYGNKVYHVVIAWGFDRSFGTPFTAYSLYVYVTDKGQGAGQLIYAEEDIERELLQFIVRDLSGDGSAEIIDVGNPGAVAIAIIRQLDRDGRVHKLQELSADRITLHLDYPAINNWLSLENHTVINRKNGPPIVRDTVQGLDWSPRVKKFLPRKLPRHFKK
jgi:hypothetical protein